MKKLTTEGTEDTEKGWGFGNAGLSMYDVVSDQTVQQELGCVQVFIFGCSNKTMAHEKR